MREPLKREHFLSMPAEGQRQGSQFAGVRGHEAVGTPLISNCMHLTQSGATVGLPQQC
ncbi:hypothetical protein Mal35_27620 [Gimesia maris]|nr:hypothetical protein Mal35_27620 [Gimesia maris]